VIALWISIAAWFVVWAVTLPGSCRVVFGKGGDHDAVKLSFNFVAVILLSFNLRWLLAPESMFALNVLRLFSAALAVFLIIIVRFYRRAS